MSILSVFSRKNKPGKNAPGSRVYGYGGSSNAGVAVTEENSMRYAAVQACVRVLSEDIAALPLFLYRRTEKGGKQRYYEHPLYRILRTQPNPEMTAVAFKESMMVNVLLTGNAYSFIEYDGRGRVIALWPMLSSEVSPYRDSNGNIRYRAGRADLASAEVLHIPGLGYDGLVGMSPISYARESIGLGIAAEAFGSQFFKNGTHIGGIISVPTHLTDEAYERTRTQFQQMYRGLQNAHGVPLLEGGATFQSVGIAPEDAQFLETRKYQRSEICGIFRVPPHMVGDLEHATFSNIEHQEISYLQRSLLPWLTRIEQAMTIKLLSEQERTDLIIEHETGSFMRGDTKSRFDAYAVGITNGILSVNEARQRENLNPIDGGDVIRVPMNTEPIGEDDGKTGGGVDTEGHRSFRLADISTFTTDSRRRAVRAGGYAAKALGIDAKHVDALRDALAPWLAEQAAYIKKLIKGDARALDDEARIVKAIKAYYAALSKAGLPGDVNRAVAVICEDARQRLRGWHGDKADVIDDAWMKGFLARYNTDMSARLIEANENEALRIVRGADQSSISALMGKLDIWSTDRAGKMADMETALAGNELLVAANRKIGYESIWIAGAGCCAVCQSMNGQTITTLKPPLHKGCTCTVTAKMAGAFDRRDSISGVTFGVDKSGKYAKISKGDELEFDYSVIKFERWVSKDKEKVIARGEEIDDIARLVQFYGGDKKDWLKLKNLAYVLIDEDCEDKVEIHWYEHKTQGSVDYKTK